MSGFQNFAVAGAGAIGINVVKALLETKKQGRLSEVRILTRSVSVSAQTSKTFADSKLFS